MSELLKLAERCEKATGPDRKIDREIARAVLGWPLWAIPGNRSWQFTASLDAAMTLVPEGHKWAVTQQDREKPNEQWWGELRRGYWTSYDKAFPSRGATPALALCAAALRAREEDRG